MSFFSYAPVDPASPFHVEPFGAYHLAALSHIAAAVAAIAVFRRALADPRRERIVLGAGTALALALESGLHICEFAGLPFPDFLRGIIPLDLCAIALWLAVALCATRNETVFEFLYFYAIGAIVSLVYVNDGGAGPDRFRYYQYFGTHGYTVLVVAWFALVRGYRIRLSSFLKAVGLLLPLSAAIRLLDLAFADPPLSFNYMFLRNPPEARTPLDSFGGGWGYYLAFASLSFVVLFAFYVPWAIASFVESVAALGRRAKGAERPSRTKE